MADLRQRVINMFTRGATGLAAYVRNETNGALSPVAIRDGDGTRRGGRILCCDSSSGSDWLMTDTTPLVATTLPQARFTLPMLRRAGLYRWVIVGDYENTVPNNTTFSATLLVDNGAVGSAFTWAQNGAVTTPGIAILTLDLYVIGNLTSPRHVINAEMLVLNSSGVAVIGGATSNTKLSQIYSLNSLAEQNHTIQLAKSVSAGVNPWNPQTIACYEVFSTSGV